MKIKEYTKNIVLIVCILTTLIISLVGCSREEVDSKETIKIATKPMSEQFILSEMLGLLIEEHTDLGVEITKGIGGGTSNIHIGMENKEFDMYPEYTGTGWSFVLKEKEIIENEKLFKILNEKYNEKYDFSWKGLYGFNNTFGLAVRTEIAKKYNIKTYSDLSKYSSELIFGGEYDFFERDDGYDSLCETYGFKFKDRVDMDIALKYNAINSGEVDVINLATTDGQISISEIVLLEDDKSFYNTYFCSTVVRNEVLEEHKELEDVIMKMDGIITEEEMAKLNYEVECEGKDEKAIAKQFLQEKGLID